jgi:hypothetical protein
MVTPENIDLEALDKRVGLVRAWPHVFSGCKASTRPSATPGELASTLVKPTSLWVLAYRQRITEIRLQLRESSRSRIDGSDGWRILQWP